LDNQTKIFSSPNCYSVLNDPSSFDFNNPGNADIIDIISDNTVTNNGSTDHTPMFSFDQTSVKIKISPIFILNHNLDFILLCKTLVDIVGENGFHCKSTQKNVKKQANSSDNYRKIFKLLNTQQNAQFHTYQLQSEKPFRVVIRNLHPSTSCDDIKSTLENFNLSVLQVVNVLQRQTKIPLRLFFVGLVKDDNSKTIFDITSIRHTKIKVEEPHKCRDLVQCQNCQDYGHTRSYCNHSPRCVRCGKNHLSSSCDTPIDVPPTCALC